MSKSLRIIFAGTPDFAARHLDALLSSGHQVVGVFTQPDRPAGRGKKLQASPVKQLAEEEEGNFSFQYSPESFPGTEVDYALEVCNAVLDVWKPTKENKAIINIPTTVENAMPHVFACQVEYIHKNLKYTGSCNFMLAST